MQETNITHEQKSILEQRGAAKARIHRSCVSVILYLISNVSPRALTSGTLNDKHRLGFHRVLDSAARIRLYMRAFFHRIHFTRDSEAELESERARDAPRSNRRVGSGW